MEVWQPPIYFTPIYFISRIPETCLSRTGRNPINFQRIDFISSLFSTRGVGGVGGRCLASRIPLFGSLWFHLASNVLQAQTPLEERPVRQNPTWQKSPSPQSQLTKVSFATIPLDKGRAPEMPT